MLININKKFFMTIKLLIFNKNIIIIFKNINIIQIQKLLWKHKESKDWLFDIYICKEFIFYI
jgi:hypothetical protein